MRGEISDLNSLLYLDMSPTIDSASEDDLICLICSEKQDSHSRIPRFLICGHSFCQTCLSTLVSEGNIIYCPLSCSRPTTLLVNNDCSSLPRNYDVLNALEILEGQSREISRASQVFPCVECHQEASLFCEQCDMNFCEGCNDVIHSHRVFKSHCRIPLDSIESSLTKALDKKCIEHPKEALDLFCKHDYIPVCSNCHNSGSHKSHEIVPLVEGSSLLDFELVSVKEDLNVSKMALEELAGRLRKNQIDLYSSAQAQLEILDDQFEKLIGLIRARKEELQSEMISSTLTTQLEIESLRLQLGKSFVELLERSRKIDGLSQMNPFEKSEFLHSSAKFDEELSNLGQTLANADLTVGVSFEPANFQVLSLDTISNLGQINLLKFAPSQKNLPSAINQESFESGEIEHENVLELTDKVQDFQNSVFEKDSTFPVNVLPSESIREVKVSSSLSSSFKDLNLPESAWKLSEEYKSPKVKISGYTIQCSGGSWKYAFGNVGFSKGQHSWRIGIRSVDPKGYLMVGICSTQTPSGSGFNDPNAACVYARDGSTRGGLSYVSGYSEGEWRMVLAGDVLLVVLNLDERFMKVVNLSTSASTTITQLPKGKTFYPMFVFASPAKPTEIVVAPKI